MPIDLEKARQWQERRKQQEESSQNNRANFYSLPREGMAKVRHLPHWEDPTQVPGVIVWTHWNIPEMGRCTCFKTWDMDCKICLVISKYSGLIKTQDWESRGRSYTNALILEDTYNPSGVNPFVPKILGINGYTKFDLEWLVGLALNPDFGDVTDPYNGRDIIYQRKKKDGAWDKQVIPRVRPIAETPEKVLEILSKMANLDKIFSREPKDEDFQNIVRASELLNRLLEEKLSILTKKSLVHTSIFGATKTSPESLFQSTWVGTNCSLCGEPQYTTPSGVTCKNGHSGAFPKLKSEGEVKKVVHQPPITQPQLPQGEAMPIQVLSPPVPPPPPMTKKGYPECFGNSEVFKESNKKCIVCSKSYECEDTFKKTKN